MPTYGDYNGSAGRQETPVRRFDEEVSQNKDIYDAMSSLEVNNKIMEQQTNLSPEEQERQKRMREHMCECETLFVNKVHEEIGETTDGVDVNRPMDVLQPFKGGCLLLHGVGQWTRGHEISDLSSCCLKQNMPKDHI